MSELIYKEELEDIFKKIFIEIQEVFDVTKTNFINKVWLLERFKEELK